jgi:putative membrane protein
MKLIATLLLTALNLAHAAPEPNGLNDAQIVKALETINEGELDAAKIAKSRAQGDGAKNFAAMMIQEHTKNLKDTKSLSKKFKIGDKKSDLSDSLAKDAKEANKQIKKADAKSFDQAYLTEQIEMHTKARDTLKNTLIPAAKSAELKNHLEETCKHVESHLAMAQSTAPSEGPTVK